MTVCWSLDAHESKTKSLLSLVFAAAVGFSISTAAMVARRIG